MADEGGLEVVEGGAGRWVGEWLVAVVDEIMLTAGYGLFVIQRVTDMHESAWGSVIGVVAKIGMPILAGYKLRVAARLNSRALRADAMEAITSGYLSIVLMVGLGTTRPIGWWWLGGVAARVVCPFLS